MRNDLNDKWLKHQVTWNSFIALEDIWRGLKDKYYEIIWKYDKKSYRKERKFYKIMRCHKNKYMTRSHMKKKLHND